MQICIPPLKSQIMLLSDWQFDLYKEYRNQKLIETASLVFGTPAYTAPGYSFKLCNLTLPVGTILIVDRYYIKQGLPEYNSVTFRIKHHPLKEMMKNRFWAKLADVQNIQFQYVSTPISI